MIVFKMMAMKHWAKYLPAMTAGLKKAGTFESEAEEAAEQACLELAILVSRGAQLEATKEIVLKEYILLPPESDDE